MTVVLNISSFNIRRKKLLIKYDANILLKVEFPPPFRRKYFNIIKMKH